jgi:hypothetical protein
LGALNYTGNTNLGFGVLAMYNVSTYKSNWWGYLKKRLLVLIIGLFILPGLCFYQNQMQVYNQKVHERSFTRTESIDIYIPFSDYKPNIVNYFIFVKDFYAAFW